MPKQIELSMSMKTPILVVEDDISMANIIAVTLKNAGYQVQHCLNADDAFLQLKRESYSLILSDIEMPGISGLQLLRLIKQDEKTAHIPVILLTVLSGEVHKVSGLDAGADDYIVKPFSTRELLARISALLRRTQNQGKLRHLLKIGHLTLDVDRQQALIKDIPFPLTNTEFIVLMLLVRKARQVVPFHILTEAISEGEKIVTSQSLYVHMRNLRRKMGNSADMIQSVRGTGYRIDDINSI